ncbi:MAG: protein arginine kinase [Verrucomicrobia bacterium]|nr:protein arginine kinase [Verrucomicrobiota bacterium]MBT4276848.1 protein arginine kinase [Verrucomicrobiota bacterium]MBT5062759.1 protein arginine kinase [Verrucomicrobiota bacterium]MBT5478480.1 protein arginine kinase [Verrucomicrobiota bacterium]MBT6238646.1 protein arginine kinase [Verrucomicrobiota bacterium]
MNLNDFLIPTGDVCRRPGPFDRIVLSSRVRLARNLQDTPFPGRANKSERQNLLQTMKPVIESLRSMKEGFSEELSKLKRLEKQILVERHLISRELASKSQGSAIVLSMDETFCVMINEEDHLRMQAILPGLQIKEAWKSMNKMDTMLESKLPIAFSSDFGYLTACPTNLGTGIRVSAMLHLPGLVMAEHMQQTITAVNKLGLAVRGLYGEGTEALGNVFQVSNQMTLGESEIQIIERLNKVVLQIIENEENARAKLLETKPKTVFNQVGRAYGILINAHIISSKEAKNLLSLVRLGVDLGYFPDVDAAVIDELFIVTEPAHIQYREAKAKSPEERDIMRSNLLRERLSNIPRPVMTALNIPQKTSDPKEDGVEGQEE